jgi:hypothetical protein
MCTGGRPAHMTRPYSEDLRERALARFEAGETIRTIGVALGISPSCVSKWAKRKREDGLVGARTSRRAQAAHAVRGDRHLAGRALGFGAFHDARSSEGTGRARRQDRASRRVELRAGTRPELQKKPYSPASKIGLTSRAGGPAGRRVRPPSIRLASSSSTRPGSRPT